MPSHLFVDESRRRDYLLCVAVIAPAELGAARAALRRMLLGGQRRVHFVDESDARRRTILATITSLELRARVYQTRSTDDVAARAITLSALVKDLAPAAERLVIESRSDRDRDDRQLLVQLRHSGAFGDGLRYEHLQAHEEPLLWVADALAWCVGAGSLWRPLVEPVLDDVRTILPDAQNPAAPRPGRGRAPLPSAQRTRRR